jgi:uncharacterized RDD family membrane protein YckC
LRVVGATGGPVGWRRALLRFAAGLATLAPAAIAAIWGGLGLWWCWTALGGLTYGWMIVDPEHLCLHDRLSRTRLVYEPRTAAKPKLAAPRPAQPE